MIYIKNCYKLKRKNPQKWRFKADGEIEENRSNNEHRFEVKVTVIMQTPETYLNQELLLRNMEDDLKSHETNLLITILKWVIFLLLVLYSYTKT